MACILTIEMEKQMMRNMVFSQKTAFDNINNDSLPGCFCFAVDVSTKTAHKKFGIIPFDETKISSLLKTDYNLYEWILAGRPVKPYFDCEMEIPNITPADSFTLITLFIQRLTYELNNTFDLQITSDDYIIMDSSRIGKLSYHLVIDKLVYFGSVEQHGTFITWLSSRFVHLKSITESFDDIDRMTWTKTNVNGGTETRFIFDITVYTTNQKFRCLNQSKKGSNRPLTLISKPLSSLSDSLVRGYGNTLPDGYRLLNVEPLQIKEAQIKKNNKKKKINTTKETTTTETNISIYDEDGYVIKGKSLMETEKLTFEALSNFPVSKQYLYLIPNNPSQSFDMYKKIRYFFHHNGGIKEDFIKWWLLSPTYNGDSTQLTIFNTQRDTNINSNYLRACCYKSQPEYFVGKSPLLDAYYNPSYRTENIEIINETCHFVSQAGTPFENDIFNDKDFNIYDADMGSGKSVAIKRLIPKYDSILILTPRITYTKHAVREFGGSSYLDGIYTDDKMACSIESLLKLPYNKTFDLVIMDECEAILSIFSSPTLTGKELNTFKTLCRIITSSHKCILAGAFITQKTVDFVNSFADKSLLVIHHKRNDPRKQAIQIDNALFNTRLIDYLESGGKPYVYFDSKKQADEFITFLRGKAHNNDFFTNIITNLIYYRSGGDDVDIDGLDTINDTWDRATMIIATPSITVGNSYCPLQTTFTSVWINFYPSCIVADTFQGHKRVRYTTTNTLYFCLPDDKMLKLIAGGRGEIIKSLVAFDKITSDKRTLILDHSTEQYKIISQKLITDANNQVIWCAKNNRKPDMYKKIIDAVGENYDITPEPLRRLLFNNAHETTLSCIYFKSMVLTFIFRCGYDLQNQFRRNDDIDKEGYKKLVVLGAEAIDDIPNYIDITTINETEYNSKLHLIKTKKASRMDKLEVERYIFDKYIDETIDTVHKCIYFDMWSDKFKRNTLNNLYREANNNSHMDFLNMLIDRTTSYETINAKYALKLSKIKHMMTLLGLSNSLDSTPFTKDKMIVLSDYIKTNRQTLHDIFGFKDRCIKQNYNVLTMGVAFLRQVIKSWNDGLINIDNETYIILSKLSEQPPYVFNINSLNQSLNTVVPMVGVNENILLSYTDSTMDTHNTETDIAIEPEQEINNIIYEVYDEDETAYVKPDPQQSITRYIPQIFYQPHSIPVIIQQKTSDEEIARRNELIQNDVKMRQDNDMKEYTELSSNLQIVRLVGRSGEYRYRSHSPDAIWREDLKS